MDEPPGIRRLTPRPVAASVDELLAGAQRLGRLGTNESRSSAEFEHVEIDGERCVVKYVDVDRDFTLRVMGQLRAGLLRVWELGLMDTRPDVIDHTVIGAAPWGRHGVALLMGDVSGQLVPSNDEPVSDAQQRQFLDAIAAQAAATWGWHDEHELVSMENRWGFFGTAAIDGEQLLGFPERVPEIAAEGWRRFDARVPVALAGMIGELRDDPAPLVAAVASTPWSFLHGDWKFSNMGVAADGRTLLLDWAYPGFGPVCHELGWYTALNRARLPIGCSKEQTAEQLAAALEARGVSTTGWWERQLGLCRLGTLVQFGWEKALGDDDELQWWCRAATAGAAHL